MTTTVSEAENRALQVLLRMTGAWLDEATHLICRLLQEPEMAAALATLGDVDLHARGFTAEQVARLREWERPLQNFSWVLPDQLAGCARPLTPRAVGALAAAGVRRLVGLQEEAVSEAWLRAAAVGVAACWGPDSNWPETIAKPRARAPGAVVDPVGSGLG
jgi:hypothetical protein